jgi:hypothetical protein
LEFRYKRSHSSHYNTILHPKQDPVNQNDVAKIQHFFGKLGVDLLDSDAIL